MMGGSCGDPASEISPCATILRGGPSSRMYWISKTIHSIRRFRRRTLLFLAALGPGIITMVADNDAGGISTYAQTGAKTGFSLLWAMVILIPMAYYVQEMTVRLGAVTKRGHGGAHLRWLWQVLGWVFFFFFCLLQLADAR